MTIRITQEIINEINQKFDCLIKEQSWKEPELRIQKSTLIYNLQQTDKKTLKTIKENCSPYIPEDAQALLNNMKDKNLPTEGLTEDNISTLLMFILTEDIACISEERNNIIQVPDISIQGIVDYIQVDNIKNMQRLNHETFLSRESAIDSILNDIPELPSFYLGVNSNLFPH